MNKCIFTGRLTKDPAYQKASKDKSSFVAFTLAVTNGYGDTEKTMFIDCCANGYLADALNDSLYKGVKVIAEGQFYTYDSKYGNNKLALNLKECEIVQHTKSYLEKHADVERDAEIRKSNVLDEYALFISHSRVAEDKPINTTVKKSSYMGMEEDDDGFLACSEDDSDLPFD
jgi:single-stranded DNA-binding protein